MRKKHIDLLVYIVILMSGCNSETLDSCLELPNGEMLKCSTISDLDSIYSLKYEHYQGFTGEVDGEVLNDFTVLIEDQASKIGRDVASNEYIESLKRTPVTGLRFHKIPDSIMSYDEVLDYVSKCYPDLNREIRKGNLKTGIDEEVGFVDLDNNSIVIAQYSKLGISGSFVILKSINCNKILDPPIVEGM